MSTINKNPIPRKSIPGRWRSLDTMLVLAALVILLPYAGMLMTSFKPVVEIFTQGTRFLPRAWTIGAYRRILSSSFTGAFLNSLIVIVLGVLLDILVSFPGAFAFAKLQFPGKKILFLFLLGALMIPPQVLMLPSYLLMSRLGWLDTYHGLIIPRLNPAFGVFLMRQFILTVHQDIDDAARIDGAGLFPRLTAIYAPICLPAITVVGVFSLMGFWNDYYWPLMIISDSALQTVSLAVAQFKSFEGLGDWSQLMAAGVLSTLPPILVFIGARKTLVENITAGAVKG